jgi:hypothetical protein
MVLDIADLFIKGKERDVDLTVGLEFHGHRKLDHAIVAQHGVRARDGALIAILASTIVNVRVGQPDPVRRYAQRSNVAMLVQVPLQMLIYPSLKNQPYH